MGVATDMVFRLLALDEASSVFKKVAGSADESAASVDESNSKFGGMSPVLLATAAAAAVVAAKCIDMAGKFQSGMETLVTGAGESQSALGMVSNGVLNMATSTGTSTQQLTSGLYMIESAGFHGAAGLQVLQAAAQGAKIGNADLGDVANATTDILNDYHEPASKAVDVTDQLVAATAAGKMKMGDLAASMSTLVPLGSAAGLSIQQLLGAVSTMTLHGMDAAQATNDLANTIGELQNPNAVAVKEMQSLGLSSTQVSTQLGKVGLTGTLTELTSAITSHMGPAGTVLQSTFQSSTTAAKDAQAEISGLPASLQKLATAYLQGSISSSQWKTDLKSLTPVNANLMNQFAGTADKAHSFNDLLTAGGPAAQTYNAALEKMTGGSTGLKTALMLTGENATTFATNVATIGKAGQSTSKDVTGWSDVTNTLAFKLDQAKEVIETLAIRIGTALIPVAEKLISGFMLLVPLLGDLGHGLSDVVHWTSDVVGWFERHKTVAEALAIGVGALALVVGVSLLPVIIASVVAFGAQAVAAGAAAIAVAAAAAPFVAIVLVVAAVAFGFLELIKHWSAVEAFFKAAVHVVGDFFTDDLGKPIGHFFTVDIPAWFNDGTKFFMSYFYDPVKHAVGATIGFFQDDLIDPISDFFTKTIPSAFSSGYHFFQSEFVDPVKHAVSDVENGFSTAFNAIPKLVSSAFSGLVGIVKLPINGVIDLVDGVIGALDNIHVSIPSWVPGVGGDGFGISIPKIPQLAQGGLVLPQSGGTQVTVAEAGQPEIVSPLPALQQVVTAALNASAQRGGYGGPDEFEATISLELDGSVINRQLVKFRRAGGQFTAARGA